MHRGRGRCKGSIERTYVALAANHLVAVELGSKGLERWLDDTTTKTEDQVKSRLLFHKIAISIPYFHTQVLDSCFYLSRIVSLVGMGKFVPSGCCSRKECVHPPIAYQRRSIAVGLVEFPPCLGSWT